MSLLPLSAAGAIFLRQRSPRTIVALLVPQLALRAAAGPLGRADVWIVALVPVYWAFQEWFLHRSVLHFTPRVVFGRRIDPYLARRHRAHHADPARIPDIFLPVSVVLVAFVVNVVVWWLLAPDRGALLTGTSAITFMALVYEWIHFLTHTSYAPRSAYTLAIFRAHRRHHFKNEHYWYGFVGPQVDRLFGTAPDPSTVETSPTCRTLGVARSDDVPDSRLVGG